MVSITSIVSTAIRSETFQIGSRFDSAGGTHVSLSNTSGTFARIASSNAPR